MVVDDDELARESVAAVLGGRGFRVAQHASGVSALHALAHGERPDLIILALSMPSMSGWEFRERQLADALLASIPVLVISEDHSSLAGAVHAAAFLPKPIEATYLLQRVEEVVAKQRQARGSTVYQRVEPASLSPAASQLRPASEGLVAQLVFNAELAAEGMLEHQLALVSRGLSHVVNNAMQGLVSYAQCTSNAAREDGELRRAVCDGARRCAEVLQKFADVTLAEPSRREGPTPLAAASLPLMWDRL
ncbi:MAG TPA: response regulator, partial [Polyangiales bacterium]